MSKDNKEKCVCKTGKKFSIDIDATLNGEIEKNLLTLKYDAYSGDSSFSETFEINYCPFCGERLVQGLTEKDKAVMRFYRAYFDLHHK